MATLERVMEMQKSGMSDAQINQQLTTEGINPAEINDSLNQAKIKNAVSPPGGAPAPKGGDSFDTSGMQASMMQEGDSHPSPTGQGLQTDSAAAGTQTAAAGSTQPPAEELPPLTGAPNIPPTQQAPMPPTQDPSMQAQPQMAPPIEEAPPAPAPEVYPPQDQYYPQMPDAYGGQDYYAPQENYSSDTISEIAEQVATEKLNEFKEKTGDLVNFKNIMQENIADLDYRLKRIENSIDKINNAVLGKVGEFSESTAAVHKDLDNLHGTVQKLMDPLVDNINELKKISNNQPTQNQQQNQNRNQPQ